MLVLFTDFGVIGPYTGQVQAVLYREAPGVPLVSLFADLPACQSRPAAYLLAAYAAEFPPGTVFVCVVDPGVGSARRALALEADGRWFVGPDNGLLALVARRARQALWWEITWRPERLSVSFHGRDLFAPVAARIARGEGGFGQRLGSPPEAGGDWPDDLAEIVYVDGFGNCLTGLRASNLPSATVLDVHGRRLHQARTFAEVPPGAGFWYENANGLAEIAINQGRADQRLGLGVGMAIAVGEQLGNSSRQ